MTAFSRLSTLRFDEAPVALGDELRGARASLGLSLRDASHALRIRPEYLEAIERCDVSALPEPTFALGFIRSYARYLGMDADDVLARFAVESEEFTQLKGSITASSGSAKRISSKPVTNANKSATMSLGSSGDDGLARLDAQQRRRGGALKLGRVVGFLLPILIIAAIGYGVVRGVDAAREVGMIPEELSIGGLFSADEPLLEASLPSAEAQALEVPATLPGQPESFGYRESSAPEVLSARSSLSDVRDGPIGAIDPTQTGAFAAGSTAQEAPKLGFDARQFAEEARLALSAELMRDMSALSSAGTPEIVTTRGPVLQGSSDQTLAAAPTLQVEPVVVSAEPELSATISTPAVSAIEPAPAPTQFVGTTLHATADTWVEMRGADGLVVYTGILDASTFLPLPPDATSLKVGNAGGLSVIIQGQEFGPFGRNGAVLSRVSLTDADLLTRFAN